jgi:Sulfotransferase domain
MTTSSLSRRMRLRRFTRRPVASMRFRDVHANDAMLISYPRSGNTWLRFLLYEVLSGETAEFGSVQRGIPGPSERQAAPVLLPRGGKLMSAHERYRSHPARTIYLVRDVRDVLLSEYRQVIRGGWFDGSLDRFIDLFLRGLANPFGSWTEHVDYWIGGGVPTDRLLVVKFEDLRSSPEETLATILSHLGVGGPEDDIRRAVAGNTVDLMRRKEDRADEHHFVKVDPTSHFVGRGLVGGWREELSDEQLRTIERRAGGWMDRLGYQLATRPDPDTDAGPRKAL